MFPEKCSKLSSKDNCQISSGQLSVKSLDKRRQQTAAESVHICADRQVLQLSEIRLFSLLVILSLKIIYCDCRQETTELESEQIQIIT